MGWWEEREVGAGGKGDRPDRAFTDTGGKGEDRSPESGHSNWCSKILFKNSSPIVTPIFDAYIEVNIYCSNFLNKFSNNSYCNSVYCASK